MSEVEASDNIERELKFPADELNTIRERLADLEAERSAPASSEDNWVLDRSGEFEGKGCILRLRRDTHGATLTFKGAATMEGGVKLRTEYETKVDDLEQVQLILGSLGFEVVKRYQKVREEWRLGGVMICLDRTPIGDFIEFEGSGAETVARRCSFRPEDAERRNYLSIYEDYRKDHPEAPRDMLFPDAG